MKTITMQEFKKIAGKIISWAHQRLQMMVTYRGKPVLKIEPTLPKKNSTNDPFYNLGTLHSNNAAGSLSNCEIDKRIYGNNDLH